MPAIPPPSPYPAMQRVDPSPDVQQRVASAIKACTEWQPQAVQAAKGDASPAQLSTEAQVCDVLDRWPLLYSKQQLEMASLGVCLAVLTAMACVFAWAVLRGVLRTLPLAPPASRLVTLAVGGALCGIGLVTLFVLVSLSRFATATLEEAVGKAFLSWQGTAPWVAAVLAVLFVLSEVPSLWRRRTARASTR